MREFKPENVLKDPLDRDTLIQLPKDFIEDKVVLGIDIYKYSQYSEVEQIYIPVIFENLYRLTVKNIRENEEYLFHDYGNSIVDYKKKFISTGDGGFQIFDNVIQAVVFALFFQMNVKRYCSGGNTGPLTKNLYQLVDSIDLRFAITMDKIYFYQANYYGPAIINNARILSKDSLNRLLIDANSIKWLTNTINTPENLIDIDKESLSKTLYFKNYNQELKSYLFRTKGKILSVEIQKIGAISAKATTLDIFNMYLQCRMNLQVDHQDYNIYIVTIGNLNSSGISS
jgi:hypothetical protein